MINTTLKTILSIGAAVIMSSSLFAGTLQDVRERGHLKCVVSGGLPGFGNPNKDGYWEGFDVDMCRAVAVAVLGDKDKVKFIKSTGKTRFTIMQSGTGDMLARNSTETFNRDTSLGLSFAGINYYDGQGFMVKKSLGIKSAKELNGASVCIITGTTTEGNLRDYFKANNMTYKPVVFDKWMPSIKGLDEGRCDVTTTDASGLAVMRAVAFKNPDAVMILPEIISKEPLGPVVRQGDDQWFKIVKWVKNSLVEAEDLGISSKNIDSLKGSKNPAIKRFLGISSMAGNKSLGLKDDWAYNVIKHVGNYSEIFDRNIGPNTKIGLSRGLNKLWKNGGLQYSAPFR